MTGREQKCTIFKASRKQDHYLYLAAETELEDLPGGLLELLGELQLIMKIDLAARNDLAGADIEHVREQLSECGYYLQMPDISRPRDIMGSTPGMEGLQ
jgi:uncharacterized protein YcgL (UPF0745 family)